MQEIETRARKVKTCLPVSHETDFARDLLSRLDSLMGGFWIRADAPFFVRMREWLPKQVPAVVLHWVNYRQMKETAIETPLPTGPMQVDCRVPEGRCVDRVERLFPEAAETLALEHEEQDGRILFTLPSLIV